jgi:hypothetical protein
MIAGHPTAVRAHYAPRARGLTSFRLQMFFKDVFEGFAPVAMNKICPARGSGLRVGCRWALYLHSPKIVSYLKTIFRGRRRACSIETMRRSESTGEFTSSLARCSNCKPRYFVALPPPVTMSSSPNSRSGRRSTENRKAMVMSRRPERVCVLGWKKTRDPLRIFLEGPF